MILSGKDLAHRIARAMQEQRVFAGMATGAKDRGSWRVMGHGVAVGRGRGIKRGAIGPVKYIV